MRFEALVGDPLAARAVDASIRVVEIEHALARRIDRARCIEESGELLVGDGKTVDRKSGQLHLMRGALVGGTVIAAHCERAAWYLDHLLREDRHAERQRGEQEHRPERQNCTRDREARKQRSP